MDTIQKSDFVNWEKNNLPENLPSERAEYINQIESGYGDLEGEWYETDDERLIIYGGTFGNDHCPGASYYTYAEIFDTLTEFKERLRAIEACPEYLEREDSSRKDS